MATLFLRASCFVLLSLAACAEPEVVRAQFGESCGVAGPVRVLELAEDQTLLFSATRIGERIFYDVGHVAVRGADKPFFPVDDEQQWTTGPCGEAPTRLDARFASAFETERWPGLALACDGEGIVSFAPEGPLAPHVVFRGTGCRPSFTAHGVVDMVDPTILRLHRYPDDPRRDTAEAVVLLDAVATRNDRPDIAAAGDHLFARTPARELVRIDLRDGSVALEQAGIDGFTASPSGRYILVTIDLTGGDGDSPRAIAVLLDRETGVGVTLAEVFPGPGGEMAWADAGFVLLTTRDARDQIYALPDLAPVTIPPGYGLVHDLWSRLVGPTPDGRWIVYSYAHLLLAYLDPRTGELTPLFGEPSQVLAVAPEGTLVLAAPPCCERGRADDEGAVWLVPHDGTPARELAARATLYAWRPRADLLVSPIDIGRDRRSTLVLADGDGSEPRVVDDHVFAGFLVDASEPDMIRYSVQDGARSGVWQVRLPP